MLALARLIRCAMVASGTRKALAISAVVRPPTARSVSAMAEAGVSAGWQHMKSRVERIVPVHPDLHLRRRHERPLRPHLAGDRVLAAAARHLAAQVVGDAAQGDVVQPAARVGGDALRRPLRRRGDQCLLHRVLRRVEVAVPPRHRAQHLRRKLAQQACDGGLEGCAHWGRGSEDRFTGSSVDGEGAGFGGGGSPWAMPWSIHAHCESERVTCRPPAGANEFAASPLQLHKVHLRATFVDSAARPRAASHAPARPQPGIPRFPRSINRVHRGFGCTPRVAGNPGELTTRDTVSPHVGRGGARKASLGTSGTAAGWKRGRGPSAFFQGTPSSPRAPRNPPSRLHLMRDPVNRPLAGRRRERADLSRAPRLCKIAHQVFVEAGSGALPAGIVAGR